MSAFLRSSFDRCLLTLKNEMFGNLQYIDNTLAMTRISLIYNENLVINILVSKVSIGTISQFIMYLICSGISNVEVV